MERKTFKNSSMSMIEWDRACIWHPFTQQLNAEDPLLINRGEGLYLYTEDGFRMMDAISSWWVNLHGHAHPYIAEKIKEQLGILEHVIFTDFTHRPAIEFAKRLISRLPSKMSKVFYSDNGSTAVEAALKMVFQYWHHQKATHRKKVISFRNGYHGDTFGAMSAAGKNAFNKPFWNYLFEVESCDPPMHGAEEVSIKAFKLLLEKGDVACFIFEPLILGAGGMVLYSKMGLEAILKLCADYGVLIIADEVMTGFGRTGSLFASDQLIQEVDIICLSKGITGGFLPLGATICKEYIFEAFLSEDIFKAFLHGHSYTANPLACVSALASLDLLLSESCEFQRKMIEQYHQKLTDRLQEHPRLTRCESIGTILVLEYKSESRGYSSNFRHRLVSYFLKNKILVRPLGNILYILPPYCITGEELQYIYDVIMKSFEEVL